MTDKGITMRAANPSTTFLQAADPRPRSAARAITASLALIGLLTLAGCTASTGSSPGADATPTVASAPPAAPASPSAPAPSAPSAAAPSAVMTVTIQDFLFAPAELSVPAGATVTVVNQDGANHTVTAKDRSFDTGNIAGHATGSFTAPTKPGSYPYICAIHPFMTGTLTVT